MATKKIGVWSIIAKGTSEGNYRDKQPSSIAFQSIRELGTITFASQ